MPKSWPVELEFPPPGSFVVAPQATTAQENIVASTPRSIISSSVRAQSARLLPLTLMTDRRRAIKPEFVLLAVAEWSGLTSLPSRQAEPHRTSS